MQYLKTVPVSWPYTTYYYPAYPQEPQHVHVSLFLTTSTTSATKTTICKEQGECTNSIFLGSVPVSWDSSDCLKKCQSYDGCTHGTFRPDSNNLCLLFQTCTRLETTLCPNCLTTSTECAQCDIPGSCLVSS